MGVCELNKGLQSQIASLLLKLCLMLGILTRCYVIRKGQAWMMSDGGLNVALTRASRLQMRWELSTPCGAETNPSSPRVKPAGFLTQIQSGDSYVYNKTLKGKPQSRGALFSGASSKIFDKIAAGCPAGSSAFEPQYKRAHPSL